jgi:hypothetical protein
MAGKETEGRRTGSARTTPRQEDQEVPANGHGSIPPTTYNSANQRHASGTNRGREGSQGSSSLHSTTGNRSSNSNAVGRGPTGRGECHHREGRRCKATGRHSGSRGIKGVGKAGSHAAQGNVCVGSTRPRFVTNRYTNLQISGTAETHPGDGKGVARPSHGGTLWKRRYSRDKKGPGRPQVPSNKPY